MSLASAAAVDPPNDRAAGNRPSNQPAIGSRKNNANDFYFGKIIGEGSFSTVYLIKDTLHKKEYAAKICSKAHIVREKKQKAVMREKDILILIKDKWNPRSPFFVKLISTFQDTESLYFVLTYAERGDFFTFLKKSKRKGIDVTKFYSGELIQAVEHLHNIGIIHRDLKPENILLTREMHILLTDFGSGKLYNKDEGCGSDDEVLENRRASFVGTAQYVSPEMLSSQAITLASDLWAVGCMIYQMISGSPPFQAGSEYLIFQKIQKLEYIFQDGFNDQAQDLVENLLVLDPQERLGSADVSDHVCYKTIKTHPFFKDLDFENLYRTPPPNMDLYQEELDQDPVWDKYPNITPGLGADNRHRLFRESLDESTLTSEDEDGEDEEDDDPACYSLTSQSSCLPESGNMSEISDDQRQQLLEEQRQNNEYHAFVQGNLILKQGILEKRKKMFSRARMFLLTEGPRLFYVDPKEKILKGEVPLCKETKTEMKNFKIFFVHTPNRIYYLIDPQSYATQWCKAIDGVVNYYFH